MLLNSKHTNCTPDTLTMLHTSPRLELKWWIYNRVNIYDYEIITIRTNWSWIIKPYTLFLPLFYSLLLCHFNLSLSHTFCLRLSLFSNGWNYVTLISIIDLLRFGLVLFSFLVWWHISHCILFNTKAILHDQWYYLTHNWEDKGFPKAICLKAYVIARLEFELAYYVSAVQRFDHYTTKTPPDDWIFEMDSITSFFFSYCVYHCSYVSSILNWQHNE